MCPFAADGAIAPLQVEIQLIETIKQVVLARIGGYGQVIVVGEDLVGLALQIVEVVGKALGVQLGELLGCVTASSWLNLLSMS